MDIVTADTENDARALLTAFLAGRNERTLRAYRQDLEDFRLFTGASSAAEAARQLLGVGHGEANARTYAYRASLLDRGLQAATVNRRLAALRSLVKMARVLGMVAWSLDVENVRVEPYRDTRGPGRQGVRRLMDAVQRDREPRTLRDRAALRLLYDLGLRRGEVVALDREDVDLERATVAVRGKGRSQKLLLTLPEPTKAALADWLAARGAAGGPLFVNFDPVGKGGRLTGTSLYRIVRALGDRAGVPVHPHGLRHTAITEACLAAQASGIPLEEVLDYSRHKDVRVLMIYRDRERNVQGLLAALVAETPEPR